MSDDVSRAENASQQPEPAPRRKARQRPSVAEDTPLRPAIAFDSYVFPIERPLHRRLNAYAFDPSLSQQLKNASINRATLKVPWEPVEPGPIGEYLEVVDVDPTSGYWYYPVDLNNPFLLAANGLPPLDDNPQFHQQMVYAVAMTTIENFEHALGRPVIWAPLPIPGRVYSNRYVQRLRIYPHALRQPNAYYSPSKVALLFGYFTAPGGSAPGPNPLPVASAGARLPGGMVFTCLSHDVIAHETTHAILDGMHQRLREPTNADMLAFHEAFADIVALFQHFSLPEVLRAQIARTRGDLETENLLAQLAQEFGQAIGIYGALRDALGHVNRDTGQWERAAPNPGLMQTATEPHARGSLLVAAIFDAFVKVYAARTEDLKRIATGGTGVLPAGQLHPDLVSRLADEAADTARYLLTMCIRGLDYCPPVDLTFGEYLRAMITADYDLVLEDKFGYRVALVEAFNAYGIYPPDVRSMSVESLRWRPSRASSIVIGNQPWLNEMRNVVQQLTYTQQRQAIYDLERRTSALAHEVFRGTIAQWAAPLGLSAALKNPKGDVRFEVNSIRPAYRVGPDGKTLTDIVIQVLQWRPGYLDPLLQARVDQGETPAPPFDFRFPGGCTLLVDLMTGAVRYAILKSVTASERLQGQRDYVANNERAGAGAGLRSLYFGNLLAAAEPFAALHGLAAGEEGPA